MYSRLPRGATADARSRERAALELLAAGERAFRRTALRFSLCADDADDAFQRAVEILLTKAPLSASRSLAAWMQVVTRREALALRRSRERLLGAGSPAVPLAERPRLDLVPCPRPGPHEAIERRERVAGAARLLGALKPQERRAIALQAEGYSYAEICRITGWTYTKVNRSLSEGRARLRALASAIDSS